MPFGGPSEWGNRRWNWWHLVRCNIHILFACHLHVNTLLWKTNDQLRILRSLNGKAVESNHHLVGPVLSQKCWSLYHLPFFLFLLLEIWSTVPLEWSHALENTIFGTYLLGPCKSHLAFLPAQLISSWLRSLKTVDKNHRCLIK